jgi:hypothetical protein
VLDILRLYELIAVRSAMGLLESSGDQLFPGLGRPCQLPIAARPCLPVAGLALDLLCDEVKIDGPYGVVAGVSGKQPCYSNHDA